jgi:hypothetical protein
LICDGLGNVIDQIFPPDVPSDDGNQCTVDTCMGGVPVHPPAQSGTPCMGPTGSFCDGAGTCSIPPTVVDVIPEDSAMPAASVSADTPIRVIFNVAMDPSSLTPQGGTGPCFGSVQVSFDDFATCIGLPSPTMTAGNTTATWVPSPGLLVNRVYRIAIGTSARSASGRSLVVPYTSSTGFKTATPPGSPLVLNESDDPFEADRCAIRSPASITGSAFTNSPVVFGQIGEIPFTPGPGADPVIVAQLGFGPATSNPQYQPGWTWIPAQFNVQAAPIEDEYRASFMLPLPGSYRYAYRFSRNGGAGWTYCDREDVAGMPGSGGSGSNAGLTFELEKLGVLTVTP